MKLKKLIIQGFKSFKDRTVINFDDAITGIVGPNGCGKSNVVDALFWIMGERSAKHLRGNSMLDVIFCGSDKYAAASWAEVSLLLENDDGKSIHIGNKLVAPTEIMLTRKLYRNGETEYRINGTPCRLRDIQEVFMDTGAGAKSYSIIAQGEIQRLVEQSAEERRVMIEEVAGITKFKARKRESLKKLEQTQSNLARLNDLKDEIEKNLKVLEHQAEKAQKARALKEKIEKNELIVSSHQEMDLLKSIDELEKRQQQLQLDCEAWKLEKDNLDIGLEQERLEKEELTEQIDDLQSEYNEYSRALATNEEKVKSNQRTIEEKEKQIELRQNELEQAKLELEQRQNRYRELQEELVNIENSVDEEIDLSDLEERVALLKEQKEEKSEELKELSLEIANKQDELDRVEKKISLNEMKVQDYSKSLEDLALEIENIEKDYSGVSSSMSLEREEVNSLQLKVEEGEEKLRSSKEQLRLAKDELNELHRQEQCCRSAMIKTESTLESLRQIRESESAQVQNREFLNKYGSSFRLLSDLLNCDPTYQVAVEALVKNINNYLLQIEDIDLATILTTEVKGINILKPSDDLASLDETLERLRVKGFDDVVELSSLFKDGPYYNKLKTVFHGFFISEKLTAQNIKMLEDMNSVIAMSSLDGHIVFSKQGKTVGISLLDKEAVTNGVVARNNRIIDLEKELSVLQQEHQNLEDTLFEKDGLVQTLQTMVDQLQDELSENRADYAGKKAALESKLENYDRNTKRLTILQHRQAETSKERLELLEEDEGLQLERERIAEDLEDLKGDLEELKEQISLLSDQYSEGHEELIEKQVAAKSYSQRLSSTQKQLEDVQGQINLLGERITNNEQLIDDYEQEVEQLVEDNERLKAANLEAAQELQDREDVLNIHKDRLANILIGMQERENRVKELSSKISKAEKNSVETEMKIAQDVEKEGLLVREIFEKYQINLRSALFAYLEFSSDQFEMLEDLRHMLLQEAEDTDNFEFIEEQSFCFIRRYGKDLDECKRTLNSARSELARLGEINWQAIKDYDRQKLRYDFITTQEAELKVSVEDLQNAIEHIDQKSKERFKIAFHEVSTRFEKVFPIIFGGGNARLNLVGDINDLDCGVEIFAQPPGKKMQNINALSGGEKAMTAVSLIFSIFLVKPSPFCLLDEVDAPLDDANVGRFNELLREMSEDSQFILITHNKQTMELNNTLYGVTMQEPGVSKAVSVQLH